MLREYRQLIPSQKNHLYSSKAYSDSLALIGVIFSSFLDKQDGDASGIYKNT